MKSWPILFRISISIAIITSSCPGSLQSRESYSSAKLHLWISSGHLADSPYWHALLGYKHEPFSYKSAADGNSFFFAPNGNVDPAAELHATAEAFVAPIPSNPNEHAICRFPARFHWFVTSMGLEASGFPEPECTDFREFADHLKAKSISYVFASFYSGHPASLFGHSFLKFNRTDSSRIEEVAADPTMSYGARVTSVNPFYYFTYGMFGGFSGTLEVQPFKFMLESYTEGEQRDLWEFRLNLTESEVEQMVRAAWEMNSTHYDYYFLSENCSYRLLDLLEVGHPGLELTDDYFWTVHPVDTVKQVVDDKGLGVRLIYYPATETRYRHRIALLSNAERLLVFRLSEGDLSAIDEVRGLRASLVADVATEAVLLRSNDRGELATEDRSILEKIELIKAGLPDPSTIPGYEFFPAQRNPLIGHETTMAMLSGGRSSLGNFSELRFRPALHDLQDRANGYSPYSELAFFTLRARVYEDGHVALQDFRLMDLLTLSPVAPGLWPLSWEVQLGVRSGLPQTFRGAANYSNFEPWITRDTYQDQSIAYGRFGIGYSYEPYAGSIFGSALIYLLLGGSLEGSSHMTGELLPSIRAGVLFRPVSVLGLRLEYNGFGYSKNPDLAGSEWSGSLNLAFTRWLALEMGYRTWPEHNYSEAMASVKIYF